MKITYFIGGVIATLAIMCLTKGIAAPESHEDALSPRALQIQRPVENDLQDSEMAAISGGERQIDEEARCLTEAKIVSANPDVQDCYQKCSQNQRCDTEVRCRSRCDRLPSAYAYGIARAWCERGGVKGTSTFATDYYGDVIFRGSATAVANASVGEAVGGGKEGAFSEPQADFFDHKDDTLSVGTQDSISVTVVADTSANSLTIVIKGGPFISTTAGGSLNQHAGLFIAVTDNEMRSLFSGRAFLINTEANPCADFVVTGDLNINDFDTSCVGSVTTVSFHQDSIVKVVSYADTLFNVGCVFRACTWHDSASPTFVELSSFTATGRDGHVEVEWKTASEVDNAGFNLQRSLSKEGPYQAINDQLIPARGSMIEGATYTFTDESVVNGTTYYYVLEDVDLNGRSTVHGPISATPEQSSVEEESMTLPTSFSLAQNYPNPFNATTEIGYSLPVESDVTLTIFNLRGQRVKTLVAERQPAGHRVVSWNGRTEHGGVATSGLYFCRLQAGEYAEVRRMVLLR